MRVNKPTYKDILAVLLPVIFAAISIFIWLAEIKILIGWKGTEWIKAEMKSVYVITLLAVFSYVFPTALICKANWKNIVLSIILLYIFSIMSFNVSKWIFRQLYQDETHVYYIWLLILTATIIAVIFYTVKQFLLFKSEIFHVMTIVAVFISIIPASLITIEWYKGYSTVISFFEAVKMGYPVFWLNILLGWVSYLMVKKMI